MIGLGLLRGVFLGGIMMWYSMSVWKTVDQYFRDQFQEYLTKEYGENEAMRQDVLVEKEKLAARKIMLEKLKILEAGEKGQRLHQFDVGGDGADGEKVLGEQGAGGINGGESQGWPGNADHGGYSAEEVDGGQSPGGGESEDVGDSDHVTDEELGEDGGVGECMAEYCVGPEDQVSTRWRNVFDEEVCHFDGHFSDEGSCSQTSEEWEEIEVIGGSK